MKYTPEKYEWEIGDIVATNSSTTGTAAAIRFEYNKWRLTSRSSDSYFSDAVITSLVKENTWKFVANVERTL